MVQALNRVDKATSCYQTYLLTCWQERDDVAGMMTWRFKLETPQFGRRQLFVTLKEVMETFEKELKSYSLTED